MKTSLLTAFFLLSGALALSGCTSQISEMVQLSEEQLAAEALKRQSGLQLIENMGQSSTPSCTPKASMKFVLTQNSDSPLYCRDKTTKATTLAVGRVCPGGVEITNFVASDQWVPCDQMTVCGKSPSKVTALNDSGTVAVQQLQFEQLPWGCVGEIETAPKNALQDEGSHKDIAVQIIPPPCPHCSAINGPTCEICGTDTTPPEILEVIADPSICQKVTTIVFAQDPGSGLHASAFSFDGGSTWQESNSKQFTGLELNLTANQIAVRDRAGNISRYPHAIKKKSDCDCRHGSLIIPHGTTKPVFTTEQVSCGQTCTAGTVSCNLGVLSGNTSYAHASCAQPLCKCVTPDGSLLDLNETRDLYKTNSIACNQTITCQDASNRVKVKCSDVNTNKIDIIENSGTLADFKHSACNVKQCSCVHLNVPFKPSDPPLKVYTKDKAVSPETCNTAALVGEVTCTESPAGTFRVSGATNTSIYKFTTCQDNATSDGTGSSVYDIGIGEGGGSGGGLGNDVGDGEGFRRRSRGGGGGPGSGCDISEPPYFCGGAGIELFAANSFCYLPTKDGYQAPAFYQTGMQQRISPGGFVAGFSRKTVPCGDSCSKYMAVIRCDGGIMSGKTQFPYTDCVESCP